MSTATQPSARHRAATVRERLTALVSPAPDWPDDRLVAACLRGDEHAWSALIDKYKNLIFSVPIKYGASQEDAADIFQSVCLELFSQLSSLRKVEALRSWLVTVARNKTFHWMRDRRQEDDKDVAELSDEEVLGSLIAPDWMQEVEREQTVREAVARLPERCQEMIRLLFYEQPPLPYNELAQRLGLATGSIGFIRGRCLKRLQDNLEEMGF